MILFHALSHSKFAEFSQGDFLQSKRRCLVVHETFFCLANCTGVACWTRLGLSESEKNPWILRKMIHTTFHGLSRSFCWLFTGRQWWFKGEFEPIKAIKIDRHHFSGWWVDRTNTVSVIDMENLEMPSIFKALSPEVLEIQTRPEQKRSAKTRSSDLDRAMSRQKWSYMYNIYRSFYIYVILFL